MLTNPVVVSVLVMVTLSLLKLPVLLSLLTSSVIAGLLGGIGLGETMQIFVGGMGGNANTALSYILLGTLAACITKTGAADELARNIGKVVKENKFMLALMIVLVAMASGTIIPVHIAFIPILIPPLLSLMDKMKFDRRMAAVSFGFGLKAPYITIPVAYGAIFHGIIKDSMIESGMNVEMGDIWRATWPAGIAMLIGLFIGWTVYSKNRTYKDKSLDFGHNKPEDTQEVSKKSMYISLASGVLALIVQLKTDSLPFGALCGILLMIITRTISWSQVQEMLDEGVKLMGYIAFVMLVASGFATIMNATGGVKELVDFTYASLGGSRLIGSFVMVLIGLLVTMGIGTSFGTVPVLAAIYVPLATKLGFSVPTTILLIAVAAALGDAGSPASDTTLGPTAGLNVDGQHDHIWDTCVPQFLCYDVPLLIVGIIAPLIFG